MVWELLSVGSLGRFFFELSRKDFSSVKVDGGRLYERQSFLYWIPPPPNKIGLVFSCFLFQVF